MSDGRLEGVGELEDFRARPLDTGPGKEGDLLSRVREAGEVLDDRGLRLYRAEGRGEGTGRFNRDLLAGDVAGNHEDRNVLLRERGLRGVMKHLRAVVARIDHFAEGRALVEKKLGVGLLEKAGSNLFARDMRGNRENRDGVAVGVVKALNEVRVAGAARAGAHAELARDAGLGACRESRGLLVAHVDPFDALGRAHGIHDGVEGVANNAVNALDAHSNELIDGVLGECLFRHGVSSLSRMFVWPAAKTPKRPALSL